MEYADGLDWISLLLKVALECLAKSKPTCRISLALKAESE